MATVLSNASDICKFAFSQLDATVSNACPLTSFYDNEPVDGWLYYISQVIVTLKFQEKLPG
jgi:hypothetical protein